MNFEFLKFNNYLLSNIDVLWTFYLLVFRFTGMMMVMPGLGGGPTGIRTRTPAILVFAFASTLTSPLGTVPVDVPDMLVQGLSEIMLGLSIGIIPTLIISGVQTAGMLSSTTMGLGAAQLVDPTLGVSVTSLARIFGDIATLLFLFMGGHYVIIHAVSGLGGVISPGQFFINQTTLELMINRSGDIFRVGVMLSAPVIVALLLTQFVMGLITKAVPTVNIFIVSFPLTIGIGLVLSALSLPEILIFLDKEFRGIENTITVLLS